jgi:hypothetical protein
MHGRPQYAAGHPGGLPGVDDHPPSAFDPGGQRTRAAGPRRRPPGRGRTAPVPAACDD